MEPYFEANNTHRERGVKGGGESVRNLKSLSETVVGMAQLEFGFILDHPLGSGQLKKCAAGYWGGASPVGSR